MSSKLALVSQPAAGPAAVTRHGAPVAASVLAAAGVQIATSSAAVQSAAAGFRFGSFMASSCRRLRRESRAVLPLQGGECYAGVGT
ncbi:MAG: hypothetical protein V4750_03245, partial [Pseudomonadota bacterium]